jgi:CcmD family protein
MQAPSPGTAPAARPPSSTTPPAQDEFVPISELPADDKLPAAPLLIAAYAVVWIVLAVYVWTLWRRFLRAEQDLKQLASRLPPGR